MLPPRDYLVYLDIRRDSVHRVAVQHGIEHSMTGVQDILALAVAYAADQRGKRAYKIAFSTSGSDGAIFRRSITPMKSRTVSSICSNTSARTTKKSSIRAD